MYFIWKATWTLCFYHSANLMTGDESDQSDITSWLHKKNPIISCLYTQYIIYLCNLNCNPCDHVLLLSYITIGIIVILISFACDCTNPHPSLCVQLPILASSVVSLYFLELTDIFKPVHSGYSCNDRSLNMPYIDPAKEVVPFLMLFSLAFVIPAATVSLRI